MLDDGLCHNCDELKWHDGPCAERKRDKVKRNFEVFCGVPDRVIDAPIPERWKALHHDAIHLEWRDAKTIATLIEEVARLETEKQDARRIGLEFALHLATETADWCIEEQEKGYLGAMRVADAIKKELSKPPASANRAEERQG